MKKKKLTLMDFYTEQCSYCMTMKPLVDAVEEVFKEDMEVLKIDTDENKTLASYFRIRSVPTFILFSSGKEIWRKSGLISKRELKEMIKEVLDR